ncbi:hypothetical protein HF086_010978 [Spodoptera exigua]|uniref:Uncharacterized protein n=1 Tax=Spodoptera exigua TaxID=7107 RepID=A0A922MFQ5_SPOEX|nr:hypothetical protein HF086_010978 [Spodoptera exigua]
MKKIISKLCVYLSFLVFSDAVPLKLIPGERNVIKDKGVTHTISRFYVVPNDFSKEVSVKALHSDHESSNSEDSVSNDLLANIDGTLTNANNNTSGNNVSSTKKSRTTVTILTKSNILNETSDTGGLELLVQPISGKKSVNDNVSWNTSRAGEETNDEVLTKITKDSNKKDETSHQAVSGDQRLNVVARNKISEENVENEKFSNSVTKQIVDDSANKEVLLANTITNEGHSKRSDEVESGNDLHQILSENIENVSIVYTLKEPTLTSDNNTRSIHHTNLNGLLLTSFDTTNLADNTEDDNTSSLRTRNEEKYIDPWSIISKNGNDIVWTKDDKTTKNIPEAIDLGVKNNLPWNTNDGTDNHVGWTEDERVENDLPWHIGDKTVNYVPWAVDERIKTDNDVPLVLEQRVKNNLPWDIEDKTINNVSWAVDEGVQNDNDAPWPVDNRVKHYLPWEIEDKTNINVPWAEDERVKTDNDVPWPVDGNERVKNNVPWEIEDKTVNNVPWAVDKRFKTDNDVPWPVDVDERVKNNVPWEIEDKTVNNVPWAVDERFKTDNDVPWTVDVDERVKNSLPWAIEDKTVNNVPWVVDEGVRTDNNVPWTVDQRVKNDLPWHIEDKIKTDILLTLKGKKATNNVASTVPKKTFDLPWTIEDKINNDIPWTIEEQVGDSGYIVKKKIYKNIPWSSESKITGTEPWYVSQLPTSLYQSGVVSHGVTNKQPYYVYTYVVHPASVGPSSILHEQPDLYDILNVKHTQYNTKFEPNIKHGYKISTVNAAMEPVKVSKQSNYEVQHNGVITDKTISFLKKSQHISQNPQDFIIDADTVNPKITNEYSHTLEKNVATPKIPLEYSLNINPFADLTESQDLTQEVFQGGIRNIDNVNSNFINPKITHGYSYIADKDVSTPITSQDYSYSIYNDNKVPETLQDSIRLTTAGTVIPKVIHDYSYAKESNTVNPYSPGPLNPNVDFKGVVANTPQDYNLDINSGVIPNSLAHYKYEKKVEIKNNVHQGPLNVHSKDSENDHSLVVNPHLHSKVISNNPISSHKISYLNLLKNKLLHINPHSSNVNFKATIQHQNTDQNYINKNIIQTHQTSTLKLVPTYRLFTVQNLLKLTNGLKRLIPSVEINVQEQNALNNLLKVLQILLIQADYFGLQNNWYEKIFYNVPPQNRHPLQTYAYDLIRQRWLHELLLILHENDFNLNILHNPGIITLLVKWQFPQYVQSYLKGEHKLGWYYSVQQNNVNPVNPSYHQVVNNYACQYCATNLKNFVANHAYYSPQTGESMMNIARKNFVIDANVVRSILQNFYLNKNAIEVKEKVSMEDNKTAMLRQIILYLTQKGYRTQIITDLIHELDIAVLSTVNKDCRVQQRNFPQQLYAVILSILRSSP